MTWNQSNMTGFQGSYSNMAAAQNSINTPNRRAGYNGMRTISNPSSYPYTPTYNGFRTFAVPPHIAYQNTATPELLENVTPGNNNNNNTNQSPFKLPDLGGNDLGGIGADDGSQWVGTSVTPNPVYTPEQTQHAVNQAASASFDQGTLSDATKPYMRPGLSVDQGMTSLATPRMVNAGLGAHMAQQTIPIRDEFVNAAAMSQGQGDLANEFQGLAGVLRKQNQMADYERQQLLTPLLLQIMNMG